MGTPTIGRDRTPANECMRAVAAVSAFLSKQQSAADAFNDLALKVLKEADPPAPQGIEARINAGTASRPEWLFIVAWWSALGIRADIAGNRDQAWAYALDATRAATVVMLWPWASRKVGRPRKAVPTSNKFKRGAWVADLDLVVRSVRHADSSQSERQIIRWLFTEMAKRKRLSLRTYARQWPTRSFRTLTPDQFLARVQEKLSRYRAIAKKAGNSG